MTCRSPLSAILVLLAGCGAAQAETLVLPEALVDLRSSAGERILAESHALGTFLPLSTNFLSQKNQAFCGVASIVMVLNTLDVAAPSTPEYEPYHTFTQDNLLDEHTEAILPRDLLMKQGMTLDQLGRLLALHAITVDVHHAGDGTLAAFRADARAHLEGKGAVIVNYLRRAIGEERGGHISPLAAYDQASDRFLILDVARYKYPPVWVTATALFDAMNTGDADNDNRTRGYVLVSKPTDAPTTAAKPAAPAN